MSVRIWGSTTTHRWAATDPLDRRIAWTFCGIRFCWGQLPTAIARSGRCGECFA